jgi:hypothetical protein
MALRYNMRVRIGNTSVTKWLNWTYKPDAINNEKLT